MSLLAVIAQITHTLSPASENKIIINKIKPLLKEHYNYQPASQGFNLKDETLCNRLTDCYIKNIMCIKLPLSG